MGRAVLEPELYKALEAYGVALPRWAWARSADEAVVLARDLGYPLVVKVVSPDLVHKSDVGAVKTDLRNEVELRAATERILERLTSVLPTPEVQGFLVCEHIPGDWELIVGATKDPVFGPVLMLGLGGTNAEILGESPAFRALPAPDGELETMLADLRIGRAVLSGYRGRQKVNPTAVSAVLRAAEAFILDNPAVSELDLNPVLLRGDRATVVDARVSLRK